jgi:hypothetical protein
MEQLLVLMIPATAQPPTLHLEYQSEKGHIELQIQYLFGIHSQHTRYHTSNNIKKQ